MSKQPCFVIEEAQVGAIRPCGCGKVSLQLGPLSVKLSRRALCSLAQAVEAAVTSAKTNAQPRCMTGPASRLN